MQVTAIASAEDFWRDRHLQARNSFGWCSKCGDTPFVEAHKPLFKSSKTPELGRHLHFQNTTRNSMVSPRPTMIQPVSPALIAPELIEKLFARFTLGWSHYVTLLSIDSPEERRFYEIEATA